MLQRFSEVLCDVHPQWIYIHDMSQLVRQHALINVIFLEIYLHMALQVCYVNHIFPIVMFLRNGISEWSSPLLNSNAIKSESKAKSQHISGCIVLKIKYPWEDNKLKRSYVQTSSIVSEMVRNECRTKVSYPVLMTLLPIYWLTIEIIDQWCLPCVPCTYYHKINYLSCYSLLT